MILQLFYSAAVHMRVGKKNLLNRSPSTNKPWWDAVCESMGNRKMQALRLFRTVSNRSNLSRYLTLRNTFKGVCRNKKQTYENEQKKKLVDSRKNPSKFWKLLKGNVKSIKSKLQPLQWFNYFKVLFSLSEQDEMGEQNGNYIPADSAAFLNDPLSVAEVRSAIRKLKTWKSPGPDGLVAEFFKCTLDLLSPILTLFFNKVFNSGNVPESWTRSSICPIHKKGSHDNPDHFRGISLINVISKIF